MLTFRFFHVIELNQYTVSGGPKSSRVSISVSDIYTALLYIYVYIVFVPPFTYRAGVYWFLSFCPCCFSKTAGSLSTAFGMIVQWLVFKREVLNFTVKVSNQPSKIVKFRVWCIPNVSKRSPSFSIKPSMPMHISWILVTRTTGFVLWNKRYGRLKKSNGLCGLKCRFTEIVELIMYGPYHSRVHNLLMSWTFLSVSRQIGKIKFQYYSCGYSDPSHWNFLGTRISRKLSI